MTRTERYATDIQRLLKQALGGSEIVSVERENTQTVQGGCIIAMLLAHEAFVCGNGVTSHDLRLLAISCSVISQALHEQILRLETVGLPQQLLALFQRLSCQRGGLF